MQTNSTEKAFKLVCKSIKSTKLNSALVFYKYIFKKIVKANRGRDLDF